MTGGERPWLREYASGVPASVTPVHATVLDAFLHTAAARPDHVVLRFGAHAHTAREADEVSDRIAAALAARGFGRGDRLAIHLQSVPEFVLAMLGVWKLGGIIVTVNPMYRERELDEVLRDSGAKVLLCEANERLAATQAVAMRAGVGWVVACGGEASAAVAAERDAVTGERDVMPGERDAVPAPQPAAKAAGASPVEAGALHGPAGEARCTDWSQLLALGAAAPMPAPSSRARPADAATFIYTSGTTGPMKAAVSTHAQLAYSADVYRVWCGVAADDTIVAIAPLVHVTGIVGYIALALAASATLVLTYRFTPQAFRDAVRTHRAGFTIGPTTAFIALTAAADVEPDDLASLDRPFSGGAPIPAAVVERYRAKFGHDILGIYGMTESTGPTHMVPRGRQAPIDAGSGTLSVGVPVPGIDCDIVGDDGRPLPPLSPGEIVLRGPQLASGYWQRDAETRSTFTAQGLRTGDIGFMDADGWLYVIDRKKDQINASGFKVWPREVEDVLYEHPAVLECAVIGQHDDYRGETVVACIALRPGSQATAEELAAFCRDRMAVYKVPRTFRFLSELPKTASGKVLRRELRT